MRKSTNRILLCLVALLAIGAPMRAMGETNLRFSWWGGDERHEATLKVIEMYEQLHPDVKIEGEYGGFEGYLEKMVTQMAGNSAPDIMQIDYAYLEPFWGQLDNFVDFRSQDTVDITGFGSGLLEGVTAPSGELIGLPTGLNFSLIYANSRLAKAAGIELKQMNWDEMFEAAAKLRAYDPEAYLSVGGVNRYLFEPYLFNITGQPLVNSDYTLGFTVDQAKAAFEFVDRCYKEGVVVPMEDTIDAGTYGFYSYFGWLNDKILMLMDFSSGETAAKSSLEEGIVVAIPSFGNHEADNTGIVLRPTNMIAVNGKSPNAQEALAFVEYFFNNIDAIDTLKLTRSVPATSKALDRMNELGYLPEDTTEAADWASSHKGGAGQNIISTNTTLETIENDILSLLYYGDVDAQKAAEQFVDEMQARADELKETAQKNQ